MLTQVWRYLPISNQKKLKALSYIALNHLKREHVYPFYASFKITARCNLRCAFCNVWRERTTELTTHQVCKVLDNVDQSSIFVLDLEGGEPLLRGDFLEILDYAKTKDLLVGMTTNGLLLDRYPAERFRGCLAHLNISIDEGHNNLHLLDRLSDFRGYASLLTTVHIVVTRDTVGALHEKIRPVAEAGFKAVVMVASRLEGTPDLLPHMNELQKTIRCLERKYQNVILPTGGLFRQPTAGSGCSSASVVISFDGRLYYPCRVLEEKPVNLLTESLVDFLESDDARRSREVLKHCSRQCYWYQNFTCADYMNPFRFFSCARPYVLPNRIVNLTSHG